MAMTAAQQLLSTLKSELQLTQQLSTLIETERNALTRVDSALLAECIAKKQPIVLQLEQFGRQRERILKMAGFPADKPGMNAFIANQPAAESAGLQQLVANLRDAAQQCRQQNQLNGGIVNVNRQYLQRALSILRGRDPETSAYGPGGEYTSGVVRQPLIGRV